MATDDLAAAASSSGMVERSPGVVESEEHHLKRQLSLRDLVLSQILTVVGSSWVGIAAGLGAGQVVAWALAFASFYAPMAVCVYYLNRQMPLEGGLYVWARRAFGDGVGFMTAWNVWAYAIVSIATILFQIPSEMAYMLGPSWAWIPESHRFVWSFLAVMVMLLTLTAYRGLELGKWIHNVSGASMIGAFALLIVTPVWLWAHGVHLHYSLALHLPKTDLTSLSLLGQVLFAASGLEYIAIMAGETHAPERLIGRSVVVATPLIVLMFVLGTASVESVQGVHPGAINYVAPIPQTLAAAFGQHGIAAWVAKLTILLLQLRILGAASYLFTGVTRLPMAAGWDHLAPAWFARLNARYRTPGNSIVFTGLVVVALLVLAYAGEHAAQAFNLLNNVSSELYALAYLAMFLIPMCGAVVIRKHVPRWAAWICALGVIGLVFILLINAYPFVDEPRPMLFAAKIAAATLLIDAVGLGFYWARRSRVAVQA